MRRGRSMSLVSEATEPVPRGSSSERRVRSLVATPSPCVLRRCSCPDRQVLRRQVLREIVTFARRVLEFTVFFDFFSAKFARISAVEKGKLSFGPTSPQ